VVSFQRTYFLQKNNRYWSSVNPHLIREFLHGVKFGVWYVVGAERITGSTFHAETINSNIDRILYSAHRKGTIERASPAGFINCPHRRLFLDTIVRVSDVISRALWPAHSPDLTLCEFYLWSSFKDKVYEWTCHTEKYLRESSRKNLVTPQEEILRVSFNLYERQREC
jgi:hypothetical protein